VLKVTKIEGEIREIRLTSKKMCQNFFKIMTKIREILKIKTKIREILKIMAKIREILKLLQIIRKILKIASKILLKLKSKLEKFDKTLKVA
jgi:hypothetical protein